MNTTAHSNEHAGLRKHSIGSTYPIAVVGIGIGDLTRYQIENLATGEVVIESDTREPARFTGSAIAEAAAEHIARCGAGPYFAWAPRQ